FCCEGELNMTYLALNLSHYVNGVAKKHGEVSQAMFNRYVIDSITNGVHAVTWVSEPFATLFDRYIAGWNQDYSSLRYALSIPKEEIWQAHAEAKRVLISYANREANSGFDDEVLTIGVARRASLYKRTDLLFTDIERLRSIARNAGPFQVILPARPICRTARARHSSSAFSPSGMRYGTTFASVILNGMTWNWQSFSLREQTSSGSHIQPPDALDCAPERGGRNAPEYRRNGFAATGHLISQEVIDVLAVLNALRAAFPPQVNF
ncbi:MAG: hypothetical protein WCD63_21685, partial [Terrimicrobiaceae bacterium]